MKVEGFMVPAERAITASPFDSIRAVMDLMVDHKIGAVVIVRQEEIKEGDEIATFHRACGIITKSDVLAAYRNTHIGIDYPCHLIMSSQNLLTCTPQMSRDQAASILEHNKNHHAIVVDDDKHFVGILSSWDIVAECARDHRA